MVDVSAKDATERVAVAEGRVAMQKTTLDLVLKGNAKKGDVLGVARIAAIMAAKKTSELIPLCHPLALTRVAVEFAIAHMDADGFDGVHCTAAAETVGPTGVEMEALTGVSIAALTLYDMMKAVDKTMRIEGITVLSKIKE